MKIKYIGYFTQYMNQLISLILSEQTKTKG